MLAARMEDTLSKRMLAILGLLAALSLGTPALMADHGKKDKHQQGKKQDRDDDRGSSPLTTEPH